MKGRWESNINVWFRLMYSQKQNYVAWLFPKQNYNVQSTNWELGTRPRSFISGNTKIRFSEQCIIYDLYLWTVALLTKILNFAWESYPFSTFTFFAPPTPLPHFLSFFSSYFFFFFCLISYLFHLYVFFPLSSPFLHYHPSFSLEAPSSSGSPRLIFLTLIWDFYLSFKIFP
jgi:hypothetical protein